MCKNLHNMCSFQISCVVRIKDRWSVVTKGLVSLHTVQCTVFYDRKDDFIGGKISCRGYKTHVFC